MVYVLYMSVVPTAEGMLVVIFSFMILDLWIPVFQWCPQKTWHSGTDVWDMWWMVSCTLHCCKCWVSVRWFSLICTFSSSFFLFSSAHLSFFFVFVAFPSLVCSCVFPCLVCHCFVLEFSEAICLPIALSVKVSFNLITGKSMVEKKSKSAISFMQ